MTFPSQWRVIELGLSFAPSCFAYSSPSFLCLLPSLSLCLSVSLSLCLSRSLARSLSLSLSLALSLSCHSRALFLCLLRPLLTVPLLPLLTATTELTYLRIYIQMNSPTCDIYMKIYIICNIYTYELTYLPSHSILVRALAGACISAMPVQARSRTRYCYRYWPTAHHLHQYLLCPHPQQQQQQQQQQQPLRPPPASSHHEPQA